VTLGVLPTIWDPPGGPPPGAPVGPVGLRLDRPVALIVEDDESAVDVALGLLAMLGYQARVARDGHEALLAVSRSVPDLILLDIHLPELDGVSFLKVLRRVTEAREVPVVAVSAVYPAEGPVARMLEDLGVSQYLSKPFNLAGLRAAVATAHPEGPLGADAEPDGTLTDPHMSSVPASWGLPCRAWVGGDEQGLIIEGAGLESLTVIAARGVFRPGIACRLEVTVRFAVEEATTETQVRLLARATGAVGSMGGSERWNLELQAAIPSSGMLLLCEALADH
jgi:CheY-like chemotaxis protein